MVVDGRCRFMLIFAAWLFIVPKCMVCLVNGVLQISVCSELHIPTAYKHIQAQVARLSQRYLVNPSRRKVLARPFSSTDMIQLCISKLPLATFARMCQQAVILTHI
jgi:hypothetical protein